MTPLPAVFSSFHLSALNQFRWKAEKLRKVNRRKQREQSFLRLRLPSLFLFSGANEFMPTDGEKSGRTATFSFSQPVQEWGRPPDHFGCVTG